MLRKVLISLFIIVIRILASTWRIHTIGTISQTRAVIAFWHGIMLPCWKAFSNNNRVAVTSMSKDGDILASLLRQWNYDVIRGSSSKGGKQVLDKIIQESVNKQVLLTPDGPRGPFRIFKAGAVVAAQRAEVPLILCRVEIHRKFTLSSWDKFEVPLPFTKIIIQPLSPIYIPKDSNKDEISEIIQKCELLLSQPINC
jgi:lysophospholipid acyltransferase (LPLAT)-like uncharacterized protein